MLEKFQFGPEEVVDGSMDLERPTYKYDRATRTIIVDQRMHDPSTSSWQTQQKVISVHQKTLDGIQ